MELRHLRYFVAVAEALSFTNAAKNLRLAQPSLTRQVKNLEEELGVRLLDRGNNRVTLTDEGNLFLLESKKILAMCGESVAAVQRMKYSETHQINIGYVAAIHHGILASTLAAFRKISPTVVLNLFDMTSAEQFEGLESRRIDLGFVGLNPAHFRDNLTFHCIAYDTISIVLPEHHPLSGKTKIELTKLRDQFFVGMSVKTHPGARDWLLQTCRAAGFAVKILQEAESEAAAIRFVADGLGIALMPEQVATFPREGVVFRPVAPVLRRESTIAWRANDPSEPLKDYIRVVKELSACT